MSAASAADRMRASKLRKRPRADLSARDRAWLDTYNRNHGKGPTPVRKPAAPATSPAPATSAPPATTTTNAAQNEDVPIETYTPPAAPIATTEGGAEHDASTCPVGPECPGCKSVGPLVCMTTGKHQWPMMSDDGAEGLAGLILAGLSMLGKLLRKDGAWIGFDDDERKRFAQALKRFIYTRASWAGRGDDVTALLFVGGMLVTKVIMSPAPAQLTGQRPDHEPNEGLPLDETALPQAA